MFFCSLFPYSVSTCTLRACYWDGIICSEHGDHQHNVLTSPSWQSAAAHRDVLRIPGTDASSSAEFSEPLRMLPACRWVPPNQDCLAHTLQGPWETVCQRQTDGILQAFKAFLKPRRAIYYMYLSSIMKGKTTTMTIFSSWDCQRARHMTK